MLVTAGNCVWRAPIITHFWFSINLLTLSPSSKPVLLFTWLVICSLIIHALVQGSWHMHVISPLAIVHFLNLLLWSLCLGFFSISNRPLALSLLSEIIVLYKCFFVPLHEVWILAWSYSEAYLEMIAFFNITISTTPLSPYSFSSHIWCSLMYNLSQLLKFGYE